MHELAIWFVNPQTADNSVAISDSWGSLEPGGFEPDAGLPHLAARRRMEHCRRCVRGRRLWELPAIARIQCWIAGLHSTFLIRRILDP